MDERDDTPGGSGNLPLAAEIPNPAEPRVPAGHEWHKCGCRVCAKARREHPDLAEQARLRAEEAERGRAIAAAAPPPEALKVSDPKAGPRVRLITAQWLALRALEPNISKADAARRLGIPEGTLTNYIYRASKAGLLNFEDPLSRLEFRLIPSAIDNLEALLAQGDKKATIETVKGTIFREWADVKGVKDTPQTVLALKIEAPGASGGQIVTGKVVGRPKALLEEEDDPESDVN